ncbi:MAG: polysaccharide biosynthesis protein GumK [Shinella sp.]|nr:polysaccharide biosynthesis protein GumK [Shinella sp.]
MRNKKIVVLTSHVFVDGFRKASVHFVARDWAARGNEVYFSTVGHSRFSKLKQPVRYEALKRTQDNRYVEIEPGLHAGAYLPALHAFSSRNRVANMLARPLFALYGSYLPPFIADQVRGADLVVFESGTPLVFFALCRKLNPKARTLYFCRDLLRSVGAAPVLRALERRHIASFSRICVPSRRLGEMLPPGGNVVYIPQGVDRAVFDEARTSPYPQGSRNAIAVGDMLFDREAIAGMAAAAPEVSFHLFGVNWQGSASSNIVVHGERAFEEIAPYIRHADIGLAPYRLTYDEVYLAESSLKLLQYGYCRLPVVLPDLIPVSRGNEVTYRIDAQTEWRSVVDQALAMPRSKSFGEGIMTWEEVSQETLAAAFA